MTKSKYNKIVRILALLAGLASTAGSVYFILKMKELAAEFPAVAAFHDEHEESGGHGKPGAAAADAHGAAPAAGGHDSGGHGAAPAAAGRTPASNGTNGGVSLVSLEEVFVNVTDTRGRTHSLALRLELEIFEEKSRSQIDESQSRIKHVILQASHEQDYTTLGTIGGKLYFKELLVARINEILRKPVVRDVHFSSFYLQ